MCDSRNLARALYDGTFWLFNDIEQSLGNGHCLLHSFIASMKSQYPQLSPIEMIALLNSVVSETYANLSAYVQFLTDSPCCVLLQGMVSYVRDRVYDTVFGDLVPLIISNTFDTNLVIITKADHGHSFQTIEPCKAGGSGDRKNVMSYKESDHYDSVVRRKIYVRQRDLVLKEHDASPYKAEEMGTEPIIAQDGDMMPSSSGKIRTDHIDHSTTFPVESVKQYNRVGLSVIEAVKINANDKVSTKPVNDHSDENVPAVQLKTFRCKHAKNLIISHYNVNSIRHKFSEFQHILQGHFVGILDIAETKIDDTFFDGQFQVDNYKLYRQDRNDRGVGIMMYINDNTPHRLLKQFSGLYHGIDFLTFEIITKSRKWYISYLYLIGHQM